MKWTVPPEPAHRAEAIEAAVAKAAARRRKVKLRPGPKFLAELWAEAVQPLPEG